MTRIGAALSATAIVLCASGTAGAVITSVGAVKALTNINQMTQITGTETFNSGVSGQSVNSMTSAAQGLIWYQGPINNALPGVMNGGNATFAVYEDLAQFPYFNACQNAGPNAQSGLINIFAGVATFTQNVTQVGLTASSNGNQYLTVWDKNGKMLGQVNWQPGPNECAFVGIDSKGIPIGLVAYGNHDVWNGQPYDIGGATIISDTWVWGPGTPPPPCVTDADCDDKNPCNGAETCDQMTKICNIPLPPDCNDNNPCTMDACDPMVGCSHLPIPGNCDDGSICTVNDQCMSGMCVGQPLDCDDKNDCTDDACDAMIGCTHMPKSGMCDDGDMCTSGDMCNGGVCAGTPVDCDDKNVCTDDTCTPSQGCVHTPNNAACDDGDACTSADACSNGQCTGMNVSCDDKNACTFDTCDKMSGCKNTPIKGCVACMVGGKTVDCDDKDACTADSCGMSGCVHTRIDGCCLQDGDCSDNETCDTNKNTCVPSDTPITKAGCSCGAPGESSTHGAWLGLAALAAGAALRRRRR